MYKIRKAKLGDEGAVAAVHVASWKTTYAGIVPADHLDNLSVEKKTETWRKSILELEVKPSERIMFVCEDSNQKILAFLCAGKERETDCGFDGELYAVYAYRDDQKKGAGRALFNELNKWLRENEFEKMRLWVLENNPSRKFYEKMGGRLLPETKTVTIGGKDLLEVAYGWDL